MKKILMFLREDICYDTINIFTRAIGRGFEIRGVKVDYLDISVTLNKNADDAVLRGIISGGYQAAFAVNAIGQQNYSIDGENIYDLMGIPFFNYIVDHPVSHHVDLERGPKQYYVFCVDRGHVELIRKIFPAVKQVFFSPHGGIERDMSVCLTDDENCGRDVTLYESFESFRKRKYGVVFTGTYDPLSDIEAMILEYPPAVRRLIIGCIEHMIENRSLSIEENLCEVLKDYGIENPTDKELSKYSVTSLIVNKYMKSYFREEIIRYLMASETEFHIFGEGWERLDERGSAILHDPLPYAGLPAMYSEAKISLNIMPLFKDGLHERIATSMLCGAAVLTDHSRYIDEVLSDYLFLYDLGSPGKLAGLISGLQKDEALLYEKARLGRDYARVNLTWDRVAGRLIDILESIPDAK